jgi:predicted ATP-dependent serine protease
MTGPRLAARACPPEPQYHPGMGAVAPVARICGRENEIEALGKALGRVASGGPAIVLMEGKTGIGKTRLLAQVLEVARGRGIQVTAGRAVSRRTVQTHLAHVFAKLHITSRTQLAAEAIRHRG